MKFSDQRFVQLRIRCFFFCYFWLQIIILEQIFIKMEILDSFLIILNNLIIFLTIHCFETIIKGIPLIFENNNMFDPVKKNELIVFKGV